MSRPVVTLLRVIYDIDLKIDYLMCCYFFSQYSQTIYYPGSVTSLTKIIQTHGDRASAIRLEVESSLSAFLLYWFTTVRVIVTVEEDDSDPGIKLVVNAIVSDNESITTNSRSVGYSLSIRDSNFTEAINIVTGEKLTPV